MSNYEHLMQDFGYTFIDNKWLELALTHRSNSAKNNERLEFLGDAILNFVVADALYKHFPDASEGQLTRMRAHFICEDMLAQIAKECQLGKYIILGSGEQRSGGHQRASILADAVEAIIGAIYLDSKEDLNIIKEVILQWYEYKFEDFNEKKSQNYKDPKTVLQELLQSKKLLLPEYHITKIEGERHAQTFYIECKVVLLNETVQGVGSSRRKAEQMAAEHVLELLNAKR